MPVNPPGVCWAGQLGMEEGDRNDVDEPHMLLSEMFLCSPAVEGSWVSLCYRDAVHSCWCTLW